MTQAEQFSLTVPPNNLMAIKAIKKVGGSVSYKNSFRCMSPDYGEVKFKDGSTFGLQFHSTFHYGGNCY